MTCIVGLIDAGRVVIGGDSAGVAGYDLRVRADQKVFRRGGYAMGFTSSFRMGQLLRYSGELPEPPEGSDVDAFMSTMFIDAVRAIMRGGGYLRKEYEVETGGTFLVGWRDRLYQVEDDFQVGVCAHPFAAVGCGDQAAMGALYAAAASLRGIKRAELALRAAEALSAGVRGPFSFVETERAKERAA